MEADGSKITSNSEGSFGYDEARCRGIVGDLLGDECRDHQ